MDERVYIVIPRTVDSKLPPYKLSMTCGRMAAHAAHVAAVLTHASGVDVADKDLIVLSVANSEDLLAVCACLEVENVSFVTYRDVDKAFEGELLTAVASWPIERNSSATLKKLRPWCCACNQVQGPRSSTMERSTFNREDSGSTPVAGSNLAGGR